jgi:hypothetical protein
VSKKADTKASEFIKRVLDTHKQEMGRRINRVPLSESLPPAVVPIPVEVQEMMTGDDCCEILRGMAEADPNHVISRNYFRVWSGIRESTWNRYYGTFEEFKRQAGIKLSRQVHKLEREVAKHASVDHYRKLEKERGVWGDKYLKPRDTRYQTILAASDFHDRDVDPFALRVFLDVAKRASDVISIVCLAGDIFDLPEFGRWEQDPRDWDVVGRIQFVHNEILRPLRAALPKAQIDLIEGNHEARLLRHLGDATPAMKAVLADLHGFDIPKLLGLDEFQINYIGRSSLAAWTQRDMDREIQRNYKVYFDSVLCHHFPKLGRKKGLPGFGGHEHKLEVTPLENPLYGPGSWYQMGAMHVRDASYTDGERWSNGFMMVHVDTSTHRSTMEYFDIGDQVWAGGKCYERSKKERVLENDK